MVYAVNPPSGSLTPPAEVTVVSVHPPAAVKAPVSRPTMFLPLRIPWNRTSPEIVLRTMPSKSVTVATVARVKEAAPAPRVRRTVFLSGAVNPNFAKARAFRPSRPRFLVRFAPLLLMGYCPRPGESQTVAVLPEAQIAAAWVEFAAGLTIFDCPARTG